MPDKRSPEDRLNELSGRRVDDASPRGFLQLAEEHRREGRFEETVEVLREGLKQHPNHVAAQVALGRCWLELDRPEKARKILDKVVDQDMTHLVAAKLLVETHIRRSDPEQARRQVDLYSVLNNSDPDIEPLRKRIEALGGPQAQGAADSSAEMPETEKTAAKAPSESNRWGHRERYGRLAHVGRYGGALRIFQVRGAAAPLLAKLRRRRVVPAERLADRAFGGTSSGTAGRVRRRGG